MTKRQKEILRFVTAFVRQNDYSPSLEEIADELGLSSVSTVHKHVSQLIEGGHLTRGWNQNRTLLPVKMERRPRAAEIPLKGIVAAGKPIETIEDDEVLEIPESFLGRGETYALKVAGQSMIDEGIRDGDFVIVERRRKARNGETVIALIDGETATLKRFYLEGSRVRLKPANPSFRPLVLPASRVSITGVVKGVLRHYR
ncbi:MAG: transcriptional repressor LexA [Acidobacteriota bacterium]